MENDLRAALADMSQYIKLEVGESFTGTYTGFARVPNRLEPGKETIELYFNINGKDKSMTSMTLPSSLVEAGVKANDVVTVTKVSKKGNAIIWMVKKEGTAPAQAPKPAVAQAPVEPEVDLGDLSVTDEPETPPVTDEDLAKAGL